LSAIIPCIVSACPLDSLANRLHYREFVGITYECNHYFLTCSRLARAKWRPFIMWKPDPIKMV
jgi:hypothetical protein